MQNDDVIMALTSQGYQKLHSQGDVRNRHLPCLVRNFPCHTARLAERLPQHSEARSWLCTEEPGQAAGLPLAHQADCAHPPGGGGAICGPHRTLGRRQHRRLRRTGDAPGHLAGGSTTRAALEQTLTSVRIWVYFSEMHLTRSASLLSSHT